MFVNRSLSSRFLLISLIIAVPVFAGPLGRATGGGSQLDWQLALNGAERFVLTVSTPGGEVITREVAAGRALSLNLRDLPTVEDGSYTWQIVAVQRVPAEVRKQLAAAREAGDDAAARAILKAAGIREGVTETGSFMVVNGSIVSPDAQEGSKNPRLGGVATNAARPGTPVTNDQVIPDDLIVQGSGCFGFDCVNNESFGFDTIRLKENNLRIKAEDTSVGSFPTNDWQLTFNDSASGGSSKFSVEDITGAKVPFTITAGASTNSIFVDSTGRIGARTSTPVLDFHISTSNTPAIRLEQTNAGGFTAQTWDVAGNEANFFVRDVTGGSRLSFRIRPGAPTSSVDIGADGQVGFGTGSPENNIHVSEAGAAEIAIENISGTAVKWFWQVDNDTNKTMKISREGGGGPVLTIDSRLDANGVTFKVDGSVQATNVVFSSSRDLKNELESIDGKETLARLATLPISKWTLKSDAKATEHIGPMAEDFYKLFNVGTDAKHISVTDASGVALSAIQGLSQILQQRDQELAELKARLAELEKLVSKQ
jgi:hypothetical protein